MKLDWKVHTPSLLAEVLKNPGAEALRQPINIFGHLLAEVAQRASEINDPALNILMLRLTLYERGDPKSFTAAQIEEAFASQRARLAETARNEASP